MITYTQGNLLEARAEALVNTVNTVGVMGKGIALMFKERFERNFDLYVAACKAKQGASRQDVCHRDGRAQWPALGDQLPDQGTLEGAIAAGMGGCGSAGLEARAARAPDQVGGHPSRWARATAGLDWPTVKARIDANMMDLQGVEVVVFEPTNQYQNVAKRAGVEKLTPARALIAELVRRYWVLGMECSLLEIQKLAWFLERTIEHLGLSNPLNLEFKAHRYGPFAPKLNKLLDSLDGSYLRSDKRIADAGRLDVIWFDDSRRERLQAYLKSEAKDLAPALEAASALIDGFESPYGMELLASVDWLLSQADVAPTVEAVREGLANWPAESVDGAGQRKSQLFDDRAVSFALERLQGCALYTRDSARA